jgi:hypothetical protein
VGKGRKEGERERAGEERRERRKRRKEDERPHPPGLSLPPHLPQEWWHAAQVQIQTLLGFLNPRP